MNKKDLSINLVPEIEKILNKFDPAGIFVGENKHEYEAEAKSIKNKLKQGVSEKKIEKIVSEVFADYFYESIVKEEALKIKKIANKIWKITKE